MPKISALLLAATFIGAPVYARSVYVNGIDVSSARNQRLSNVNISIDENGNVFVEAPHYQVNEENTYVPLSSWVPGINMPRHQTGTLPNKVTTGETLPVPGAGQKNTLPSPGKVPGNGTVANPDEEDKPAGPQPGTPAAMQEKAGTKAGG